MVMIDLTGKRFNSLTVLRKSENKNKWGILWVCQCDCGKIVELRSDHVRYSQKTCSDCAKKVKVSHGATKTREYRIWCGMIERCCNENNPSFRHYGGRGIEICSRWRKSFGCFISDMGRCPSVKHSIDRYPNNNGNYEPSNCRWATVEEQSRNKRDNVILEYNGDKKVMKDWAAELGICYDNLRGHFQRKGEGVIYDLKRKTPVGKKYSFNGSEAAISQISGITGIPINVIYLRIKYGWDMNRIINTPITKRRKIYG